MEPLIIKDWPMPPSVNTMLMPVMGAMRRNKKGQVYASGRMVKSKEHVEYAKLCNQWALKYQRGLERFKEELQTIKAHKESQGIPFCLSLDAFYLFNVERILTVNNKTEKLDIDNRLKSLLDNLCRILEIDDKHIFKINAEKCSTITNERVILKISLCEMRSADQIKHQLSIK